MGQGKPTSGKSIRLGEVHTMEATSRNGETKEEASTFTESSAKDATGSLPAPSSPERELLDDVKETLEQVNEKLNQVYGGLEGGEGVNGANAVRTTDSADDMKKLEESCLLLYDQPVVAEEPVGIPSEAEDSRRELMSPTRQLMLETRRNKKDAASLMRWVIFPNNRFILVWDGLVLTLVAYIIFYLPFEMGITGGFHASAETSLFFIVGTVVNLLFLVDVGLNFFRAYYDRYGRLVVNRSKIAWRYFKGYFIVDFVACLPVDLILFVVPEADGRVNPFQLLVVFNLFRLFRISRAFRVLKNSSFLLRFRLSVPAIYFDIVSAFFAILVFMHWTGCLMAFVVLCEAGSFLEEDVMDENKPNWMQRYTINQGFIGETYVIAIFGYEWGDVFNRYILSLYWAVTTTTTIGYGDIVPATSAELWVQATLMLFSGFVWAVLLARAIEIVGALRSRRMMYRTRLRQMNHLIRAFRIDENSVSADIFPEKAYSTLSSSIASHARLYIHRQHKSILGIPSDVELKRASPVLSTLTVSLRNRICLGLVHRYLVRIEMFRHPDVSLSTLGGVASLCKVVHYDAGNSIVIGNDTSRPGLYILVGGIVSMKESASTTFQREFRVFCSEGVIGRDILMLPKRSPMRPNLHMLILTHTEMIYVPREAVFALFRIHPQVWKDYGRWYKLKAILKAWGRAHRNELHKLSSHISAFTSFEEFVQSYHFATRSSSE